MIERETRTTLTTRTDKEWMVAERMNGELISSDEVEFENRNIEVRVEADESTHENECEVRMYWNERMKSART